MFSHVIIHHYTPALCWATLMLYWFSEQAETGGLPLICDQSQWIRPAKRPLRITSPRVQPDPATALLPSRAISHMLRVKKRESERNNVSVSIIYAHEHMKSMFYTSILSFMGQIWVLFDIYTHIYTHMSIMSINMKQNFKTRKKIKWT